jgi:ATP-dependent DNA helicase RecQ
MFRGSLINSSEDEALDALRALTKNPQAQFRDGQRESIDMLVRDRSRAIVVQRTGWGKSAVYFVATQLLRKRGLGPTLIVSPLLALMNNQIDAASALGLSAYTINSSNDLLVDELAELLSQDQVDLLLISPERLANPEFIEKVMPIIGRRPGLIVIDEVHCISDWGHDFRPDYRRLGQVVSRLPAGIPILGTTATANDKVIEDVSQQLGKDIPVFRGPLRREGLALSVLDLPDRAERLVWLDKNLHSLDGTGIIYCLTQRDVDIVAGFLESRGHKVARYRSGDNITQEEKLLALEQLLNNDVKAVVASTALGMGYDKPDVSFVIHYQSTDSLVGYYQQVGRAGRALSSSVGIMMRGSEDKDIHNFFIKGSFPKKEVIDQILAAFEIADGPLSTIALEKKVNLRAGSIESTLKQLHVEGIVDRIKPKTFERTLKRWEYPTERVEQTWAAKRRDADIVAEYFTSSECRMRFIVNHLNDADTSPCGLCDNCTGRKLSASFLPSELAVAHEFLRRGYLKIEPRKRGWNNVNIPPAEQSMEGRCLSKWKDGGFGDKVAQGKQADHFFDDELIDAVVTMLNEWQLHERPTWMTCVPSTKSGDLVPSAASRIAEKLGIPFHPIVSKVRSTPSQKSMENSAHQGSNVSGSFQLTHQPPNAPVFLFDDLVDSRWTLTEIGRLLRQAGCGNVYPVALASTQSGDS